MYSGQAEFRFVIVHQLCDIWIPDAIIMAKDRKNANIWLNSQRKSMQKSKLEKSNLIFILVGLSLICGFFSIGQIKGGYDVHFTNWTENSVGELRIWVMTSLLLFPACCFLGYAFRKYFYSLPEQISNLLSKTTSRQRILGLIVIFTISFGLARYGNTNVLHGYPITDDEWGTKFGGDVLASGNLMIPDFQPTGTFDHPFLYKRDGKITSFDFPGILATWAVAKLTNTDTVLWAIAAGLTTIVMVLLLNLQLSAGWALVGAGLMLFSPMHITLSITSHAHVLSKLPLACALLFYFLGATRGKFWYWFAAGFFGATMMGFRLFEGVFIALPFAIYTLYQCYKNEAHFKNAFWAIVAGAFLPLLIQAFYYQAITGDFWYPPRFARGMHNEDWSIYKLWERFGLNVINNIFLLNVWFLGFIGTISFVFGVKTDWFSKVCAYAILSVISLGLLHDDHGIHSVGPIHYSECVLLLVVICVNGLKRIWELLPDQANFRGTFVAIICLFLSIGLTSFTGKYWKSLEKQAIMHKGIFDFITEQHQDILKRLDLPKDVPAIVVAPKYLNLWVVKQENSDTGSFVYDWPMPSPEMSEQILFVRFHDGVVEKLQKQYPNHMLLELLPIEKEPYMSIKPYLRKKL